ncbi:NADase-type glycan-binding domain-containing protein [Nocardioides sp. R1-1]|uniref:NADase-type glycan-binding domain-containing protein n=1 Tax=Nocardioides sp. R1-1 TaxID=3383502 RepID=UPI0038D01E25
MTTPTHCSNCGHELGVGRFCTNCGQPVPGRHPEAAPAASAPAVPPPTGQLPPAARYPLYADSPPPPDPRRDPPDSEPFAAASALPPARARRAGRWLPWVAGVAVLALVAGIGAFLLLGSGDDSADSGVDGSSAGEPRTADAEPATPGQSDGPDAARPDRAGTDGPVEAPPPGELGDLAASARARVPATAPASRDRQGNPVTYVAENMLDGRPRTAWRMPGDGTGRSIVFDLGAEVVLTEVGLVNGYAKVDGADDWYRGNRRVRTVQWEFDDGTRITQQLDDRRRMQLLPVGPLATSRVVLHLVAVSAPGAGPTGRDFTAVSDVRLRGAAS